jgi:hypothetical protein
VSPHFSPDGEFLALAGTREYWLLTTGDWRTVSSIPRTTDIKSSGVWAFSSDARLAAMCLNQTSITLVDVTSGEQQLSLSLPAFSNVTCLRFSPDNRYLAIMAVDGVVRLWDLAATNTRLQELGLGAAAGSSIPIPEDAESQDNAVEILMAPTPSSGKEIACLDIARWKNETFAPTPDENGFTPATDHSQLPVGYLIADGVEFQVGGGMIALPGRDNPNRPQSVRGIEVDQYVCRIHILHSAGFLALEARAGEEIGQYILNFADGTSECIPIISEINITDFHLARNRSRLLPGGSVAWAAPGEHSVANDCLVSLCKLSHTCGTPNKKMTSIDIVTYKNDGASLCCFAVTLELAPQRQ